MNALPLKTIHTAIRIEPIFRFLSLATISLLLPACGGGGSHSSSGAPASQISDQTGATGDQTNTGSQSQNNSTTEKNLTGVFYDSPVTGLTYLTPTLQGTTKDGKFLYRAGEVVTFKVGDVVLGAAKAGAVLTPLDLVPSATAYDLPAVLNRVRLLLSLDSDHDPANGIQLNDTVFAASKSKSINFDVSASEFESDGSVSALLSEASNTPLESVTNARQHFSNTLHSLGVKAPGLSNTPESDVGDEETDGDGSENHAGNNSGGETGSGGGGGTDSTPTPGNSGAEGKLDLTKLTSSVETFFIGSADITPCSKIEMKTQDIHQPTLVCRDGGESCTDLGLLGKHCVPNLPSCSFEDRVIGSMDVPTLYYATQKVLAYAELKMPKIPDNFGDLQSNVNDIIDDNVRNALTNHLNSSVNHFTSNMSACIVAAGVSGVVSGIASGGSAAVETFMAVLTPCTDASVTAFTDEISSLPDALKNFVDNTTSDLKSYLTSLVDTDVKVYTNTMCTDWHQAL